MSANLLPKIDFGNEAGDDADPDELASYFVERPELLKFSLPSIKLSVSHARKGVGKSALLKWTARKVEIENPGAIVINCRGADLVRSRFGLSSPLSQPNDYIRDWMVRLCSIINRHLARTFDFASNDDEISLVEMAEIEGFKSKNLVSCLTDRLFALLKRGEIKKIGVKDETETLKRIADKPIWIFIDDLDATYQNTKEESLSLATFFSACRYLLQDVKGLIIRVTMRTDVWALIRRYDESLDKVEQYVTELLWYQGDFLELLALRIKSSLEANGQMLSTRPDDWRVSDYLEKTLGLVFSHDMLWAEKRLAAYKVIYTLSYERPRWAVQLCKLAQEAALRDRSNIITKDHIDNIWGEYGAKRIADLVAEHKHQCPQVEELLNCFRGANRLMTRDELFSWINRRISQHLAPRIEGVETRSPMDIARFLYRLGFILARSDSDKDSYEHYRFDQMPDFLSSRSDNDFGLKWEIHPCYREALDIKKLDKSHKDRFSRLRQRR